MHAGLNVIESWNSANDFIFFGKGGELATNKREDQELAVLLLTLATNLHGVRQHIDATKSSGRTGMGSASDRGRSARADTAVLLPCQSVW